jgi:hypothetical protein
LPRKSALLSRAECVTRKGQDDQATRPGQELSAGPKTREALRHGL